MRPVSIGKMATEPLQILDQSTLVHAVHPVRLAMRIIDHDGENLLEVPIDLVTFVHLEELLSNETVALVDALFAAHAVADSHEHVCKVHAGLPLEVGDRIDIDEAARVDERQASNLGHESNDGRYSGIVGRHLGDPGVEHFTAILALNADDDALPVAHDIESWICGLGLGHVLQRSVEDGVSSGRGMSCAAAASRGILHDKVAQNRGLHRKP